MRSVFLPACNVGLVSSVPRANWGGVASRVFNIALILVILEDRTASMNAMPFRGRIFTLRGIPSLA